MRIRSLFLAAALMIVPLAGAAQSPEASPTPAPKHDVCKPVPEPALDWIAEGLEGDDVTLGTAWAVKSDDFENVWFVAADLQGPDLDDEDGEIALFATNAINEDGTADENAGGRVLAVGGFAERFTDWPDADDYDISDEDDGADDAVECVEASLEDARD